MFKTNNNDVVRIGDRVNETIMNLFKNKKSRNLTHIPNIKATMEFIYLIPNAKKAFNYLRLVFI